MANSTGPISDGPISDMGFAWFGGAWARPWTERPRQTLPAIAFAALVSSGMAPMPAKPTVADPGKWMCQFSEPVRQKPAMSAACRQTTVTSTKDLLPRIIEPSRYWRPLSEPVWSKPALTAATRQDAFTTNYSPIVFSVDKWVNIWRDPVWSKPTLTTAAKNPAATISPWALTQQETVLPDKYYIALSEPVRYRWFAAAQQMAAVIDPEILTHHETIRPDKWYIPLSEPVRFRKFGAELQQTAIRSHIADIQSSTIMSNWFQGLRDPVQLPKRLDTAQQQFAFYTQQVIPEQIHIQWMNQLYEPVRIKPGLAAGLQQFFTISPFAGQAPGVLTDWFALLSEPVRVKSGLAAAAQQFFTISAYGMTQPETVTADRWWQPFSHTIWARQYLTANQPATTTSPTSFIFVEQVHVQWLVPLAEPVRKKPELLAANHQSYVETGITPVVSFRWLGQFSEPVRVKPGLNKELQQAFTISPVAFLQPAPVNVGWYRPLENPVWLRTLQTAQQQVGVLTPVQQPEVVHIQWFASLSEPQHQKPGLAAGLQKFQVRDYSELMLSTKWWQDLAQPTRRPWQAANAPQPVWALPFVVPFVPPASYAMALSNPVWLKQFMTALQPATPSFIDDYTLTFEISEDFYVELEKRISYIVLYPEDS